jgi:hypothetical protein
MLGHILYDKEHSELFGPRDIIISLPLKDGMYVLILKTAEHEERRRVMVVRRQ